MFAIDRITVDDLPALAELNEGLTGEPTDSGAARKAFERMRENPDYILVAARLDGVLIGSATAIVCRQLGRSAKPFMLMENFVVAQKHRGRGFGKQMLAHIENEAKARGCRSLIFMSSMRRPDAHKFYQAAGYPLDEVQGFRKKFE